MDTTAPGCMSQPTPGEPFNPYLQFNNALIPEELARPKIEPQGAKLCYGVLRKFAGQEPVFPASQPPASIPSPKPRPTSHKPSQSMTPPEPSPAASIPQPRPPCAPATSSPAAPATSAPATTALLATLRTRVRRPGQAMMNRLLASAQFALGCALLRILLTLAMQK